MDRQVKARPELEIVNEGQIPNLLVRGEVGAVLELTIKDKNGKVTDHRIMKSRSFVRQFLELLFVEFNKLPPKAALVMKDIGGFPRYIREGYRNFDCAGGVGDLARGIMVGTGTTTPTIDDYQLETRIAHGTSAGQLQYGGVTFGLPASDPTTSQFTITRDFSNASGGDITVNEIGLYVVGWDGAARYFMAIRDVIASGIVVPSGQTLTVNYREQAVV